MTFLSSLSGLKKSYELNKNRDVACRLVLFVFMLQELQEAKMIYGRRVQQMVYCAVMFMNSSSYVTKI